MGDENNIVKLLDTIFNGWPHFDVDCSNVEHWKWKYVDNYLKKYLIVVAEKEGDIVGCHHSGYVRIKIGEEVHLCAQGMDLGTHPQFRKIGINKSMDKLNDELFKEGDNRSDLNYSVTSNPIVIKNNKKQGKPFFPRPVSHLIYIKDVDKHLATSDSDNKWLITFGVRFSQFINKILSLNRSKIKSEIKIDSINMFDERINKLYENVKSEYDFIIENSKDYLNWRYADLRGGNYRILIALDDNEVIGYMVNRINKFKPDYHEGFIVDYLALPGRDDAIDSLVSDSIQYFNENNVNVIHCWIVKGHKYEEILSSNGFIDSRSEVSISLELGENFVPPKEFLNARPDRLHFTYGLTDWI